MQIYIHRNNQQIGPLSEAEVRAQLASGTLSPQDHVWWQGQAGWVPLSQSRFLLPPGAVPATGMTSLPGGTVPETSKLAVASLVCGCVSLLCGIFSAIPAIILGHMGRAEIKRNPGMQGNSMAIAGLILGYFLSFFFIVVVVISFLIALGNQVKTVNAQITEQLNSAQSSPSTTTNTDLSGSNQNSSTPAPTNTTDQPATTPDQPRNGPVVMPPTNAAPDATTNSAPVSP